MPNLEPDLQQTDADLIRATRAGDETALSALIKRHLAPLYRFLYRLVGDAYLAEDLTQETFLKMWKHLPRYDLSKTFKTWLYAIARNTAIDELRKKRPLIARSDDDETDPLDSVPDVQPLPDEVLAQAETAKELEVMLADLPLPARSIVLMHDIEDLTFQEIAEAVDEPMNTVKSRYRRAIASLRARFMHQRASDPRIDK